MADEIISDLEEAVAATARKRDAVGAGARLLGDHLVRLKSYKENTLNKDLRTMKEGEQKAALAVFSNCVSLASADHRRATDEARALGPYIAGLSQAQRLVEKRRGIEHNKIAHAQTAADDDDEWRRGKPEATSDGNNRPATDEVEADPEAKLDTETEAAVDRCAHCTEPRGDTGGDWCSPCISYRNRHKKPPPAHVLKARRERRNAN